MANFNAQNIGNQNSLFWGQTSFFREGENHQGTSFALFFGCAWHQMSQKGQHMAQVAKNAKWAKLGPKILFFVEGAKLLVNNCLESDKTPHLC